MASAEEGKGPSLFWLPSVQNPRSDLVAALPPRINVFAFPFNGVIVAFAEALRRFVL
jgi:hypothetical protein